MILSQSAGFRNPSSDSPFFKAYLPSVRLKTLLAQKAIVTGKAYRGSRWLILVQHWTRQFQTSDKLSCQDNWTCWMKYRHVLHISSRISPYPLGLQTT